MRFSISTLLLLLISTLSCQAQGTTTIEDDFEGNGTITSWAGDDCGINTSFSNPYSQGINTSATVLEYDDAGGQYANIRFDLESPMDLSSTHTFSFKIYVPSASLTGSQANQVSLKLQDGTTATPWSTQTEIIHPIALDQWQEVSFDFANGNYINLDGGSLPPIQRTDLNRVLIQVNGEDNTDKVVAYIDDFAWDGTVEADPVYDQLIWSDEFDVDGAIDGTKWFHQTLLPNGTGWFNNEIQHYTDRTDNAVVENGILKIIAKKENYTDQGVTKDYTSARLNSKFAFTNGRVEIRAKLPTGVGTWPALWMLGKNINEDGGYWDNEGFGTTPWPACGEIDIMEHWGTNQNYVQSAMHTPSSSGATVNHGGQVIPTASTNFHVYELIWTEEKMVFSVDGGIHYTYNPPVKDAQTWPFEADQYILMNIAIEPGIDPSWTSGTMEIDYVRVYEEGEAVGVEAPEVKNALLFPNPVQDQATIRLRSAHSTMAQVELYGIDGRLIRATNLPVNNQQVVIDDLGDLAPGSYLVLLNVDGERHQFKVIKD